MGCGASTPLEEKVASAPQAQVVGKRKSGDRSSRRSNRQVAMLRSELNSEDRASPCKLGKKAIKNSFVVQKQRNKNRQRNFDTKNSAPADDEFGPKGGSSFTLPAENASVTDAMGVNRSAPSFKVMRPNQRLQKPSRFAPASLPKASETEKGDEVKAEEKAGESESDVVDISPEDARLLLGSTDMTEVLKGVTHYREKLSQVNPQVAAVRGEGIIPRLVALLDMDTSRALQYEIVWTLTNICSAEHDDCQDVVDHGAVSRFIKLLQTCDDTSVLEQAIWALGNIAADSPDLQRAVLEEGVVAPLIEAIQRNMDVIQVLRHAAWLLSNLCRPKPQSEDLYEIIPTIKAMLELEPTDSEVCTHALWALAYISADEEAVDDVMMLKSVLPKMVQWVAETGTSMTTPSLRVLGNLCSGSPESTQAVVDAGGVPAVMACLQASTRDAVKKECIWSLSNVAAGTSAQVKALADAQVFSSVGSMLKDGDDSLKHECVYVLANPWAASVKMSAAVAQQLLLQQVIQELGALLDTSIPNALVVVALEGLSDAVKKGKFIALSAPSPPTNDTETDDVDQDASKSDNPVIAILKEESVGQRMNELETLQDEALQVKLRTLRGLTGL